jgi:hypothetical protein
MSSRQRGRLLVLILVSPLFTGVTAGCGVGRPAAVGPGARPPAAADRGGWTVLQYAIADTDLEPFLLRDLEEMGDVDTGEGLDIVALVDRAAGYSDEGVVGLGDWQGARILELGEGGADGGDAGDDDGRAAVVEELGDVNTGDPAVLADFVATAVERYPSEHYALVIADHGASWSGVGGDESAHRDPLELAELRSGLRDGLDRAGIDRLDLLGFDACLMATYEVASNLAPVAERMVASEELEPGHGWDYGALQVVADDPGADADDLGRALVDGFGDQADDEGTGHGITLSLLDLAHMPALDEAVAGFGEALSADVDAVAPVVGHERARAPGFGRHPDPTQDTHMTDLGRLAGEIGDESSSDDVADGAAAVVDALDDVVVRSVAGEATSEATGLSIYFPPRAELFSPAYGAVDPGGAWSGFLGAYYATGAAIPPAERPRFTEADGKADATFDDDGLELRGTFDPAVEDNLAGATIGYGLDEDDGSITLLGEEPASLGSPGSGEVTGRDDLTALTISDGSTTAFGYLQLSYDEDEDEDEDDGLVTIEVPLAYYPSGAAVATDEGQDALLSLTVDDDGTVVEESWYALDTTAVGPGTFGELMPSPDGIIFPLVPTIGTDGSRGWIATTTLGLHADPTALTYDLTPVPAGTPLYAHLTLTDFAHNTATLPTHLTTP